MISTVTDTQLFHHQKWASCEPREFRTLNLLTYTFIKYIYYSKGIENCEIIVAIM
jgi:hypothetical protein